MGLTHGKNTHISLDSNDLSTYVTTSSITKGSDEHDVTTYTTAPVAAHKFEGGLLNGSASMSGLYDSSVSAGPRAVIKPLVGTVVSLVRRPEGTGSGKPQDVVDVLVKSYVETNPVADYVTWSCDMTCSGLVDETPQT